MAGMDKELRDIIVGTVFSLLYITFGVVVSAVALTNAFRHATAIRNNVVVEGTVHDLSCRRVHVRRGSKKVYAIVFLYEYEGQEYRGTFETSLPALDLFRRSSSIESKYRIGNRMSVLITPEWSLIVYADRWKVMANDAFDLFSCCILLIVAVAMLYRQLDAIWERKGPPVRP